MYSAEGHLNSWRHCCSSVRRYTNGEVNSSGNGLVPDLQSPGPHISRSDGDFQERLSLRRVFIYYSDREGGGEERRAEYVWLCDCLV